MIQLVLASHNAHKLREFQQILSGSGLEVVSQEALGCREEAEETGETFAENARLKALTVMRATGRPAVADDSGLCVDALDGEPGVRSARYTGRHEDTDADRCALLLRNLAGKTDRSARFVCCICCAFPDGSFVEARGECPGEILPEARGENGFGYDPVFRPEGFELSMAQLTEEEKNAISHRARALAQFKERLCDHYAPHQ